MSFWRRLLGLGDADADRVDDEQERAKAAEVDALMVRSDAALEDKDLVIQEYREREARAIKAYRDLNGHG